MGRRTEVLLLVLTLAAVGVFAGSFIAGLIAAGEDGQPAVLADPARRRARADAPEPRALVEVLNASGRAGLARRATERLREGGFDVVSYGNAGRDASPDTSIVLDRIGDLERARAVARHLGIERVRSDPDSTLLLDVTVLLGADWQPGGGGAP